ncbi:hypothetical protein GCM10010299_45890 [Streptomyces tanashiensis]|nr:hypothetical protein GCM10010299_45890 [Streptomyces tanashiensis]
MTAHDKVRIGSITKVFVATVVLQLVAEGRVGLETPVRSVLPALLPARFTPVTVAHLLNHTSGLPDHVGVPEPKTAEEVLRHRFDRWTPREWVATATYGPLKFTPGSRQEYRGINYVLAALLIDELTGRPYGKAVEARILSPLGLAHTACPAGQGTRANSELTAPARCGGGAPGPSDHSTSPGPGDGGLPPSHRR